MVDFDSLPTYSISPSGRMRFARGPFGEILPPPLVNGLSEDEALERLYTRIPTLRAVVEQGGRTAAVELALMHAHGLRLREVLGSALPDDKRTEDERDLRTAILSGERISLRPLGREAVQPRTFVPVIALLQPPNQWQLGLPERGARLIFSEADPGRAVERGQAWYREQFEKEFDPKGGK